MLASIVLMRLPLCIGYARNRAMTNNVCEKCEMCPTEGSGPPYLLSIRRSFVRIVICTGAGRAANILGGAPLTSPYRVPGIPLFPQTVVSHACISQTGYTRSWIHADASHSL